MFGLDNIIEKTLGDGERFMVNKSCVIGFSNSVKISLPNQSMGWSKSEFVVIEGPGLVFVETGP
jgi:uncharacterized protein (AIM24 family)